MEIYRILHRVKTNKAFEDDYNRLDSEDLKGHRERALDIITDAAGSVLRTYEIVEGVTIEVGKLGVSLLVPGPGDEIYVAIGLIAKLGKLRKAGKIAGYTKHALHQAISRNGKGVAVKAIRDAVKNPVKVVKEAKGTTKYIGKDATVVLNEAGEVVTTWARNSGGVRSP